jgi:hypothetical protein
MQKDLDDWVDSRYSKSGVKLNVCDEICGAARTSACYSMSVVAFCTKCPPNHLDLFTCSLGTLRHQFDASRISFEWLNSLQLSEYVIFI